MKQGDLFAFGALRLCILAAIVFGHPKAAAPMEIKAASHQLFLSGPVVGDEFEKVSKILADNPAIDTAILRNSTGGDAPTGYRIGELFRAKGLRTAVSGYCYSSCSRMFLGGMTRYFTDDFPPEYTNVGFHGHYDDCHLNKEAVARRGLKNWTIKYSDGKADPALVERWINIPICIGMAISTTPGCSNAPAYRLSCARATSRWRNRLSAASRSIRPRSISAS